MDNSLPKVIIVDDDVNIVEVYMRLLCKVAVVIPAYDVEEGSRVIDQNRDVKIVALDGWIPLKAGEPIDHHVAATKPLIGQLKKQGFEGAIIAASACVDKNIILLNAGCTHNCPKGTGIFLSDFIKEVLAGRR